jgi:hypothetical protein
MSIHLECEMCKYSCTKQSFYDKHLITRKHLNNINGYIKNTVFECKNCKKHYYSRNGLWNHSKKCELINDIVTTISIVEASSEINVLTTLVLEIVKNNTELQKQNNDLQKQNNELHKQVIEVCKNIQPSIMTNSNNNNNNNIKTFNLNFFLNEQCKDAMNISEFVKTFDLQLADLESVGELGYVEGITKIMIDKLNSMDIYKRPIHCSDAKREIMYVKDEDKWEKEGRNNPKLRKAIKTVSFQNMKLANLWSNTYPESKNNESYLNDTYMKLIRQSTGGSGDIGISEDKIIRRIAKEVIIGKL